MIFHLKDALSAVLVSLPDHGQSAAAVFDLMVVGVDKVFHEERVSPPLSLQGHLGHAPCLAVEGVGATHAEAVIIHEEGVAT